jgi:hypothetical protein
MMPNFQLQWTNIEIKIPKYLRARKNSKISRRTSVSASKIADDDTQLPESARKGVKTQGSTKFGGDERTEEDSLSWFSFQWRIVLNE